MDRFIFADLVRYGTSTCAYCASDEGAFTAARQSADSGASGSGSADDFQAGVVLMVVCGLCSFRPAVGSLREAGGGQGARDYKNESETGQRIHCTNL